MADYTQDLIRLANVAVEVSDGIVDEDLSDTLWQALEALPLEIRLALDTPVRSAEEWQEIFHECTAEAFDVLDKAEDTLYHVEP